MFARIKHWLTHVHEWDTIREGNIVDSSEGPTITVGRYYILRCKSCGNIKQKEV